MYSVLFVWREKGDYGEFVEFNEEKVIPLISKVEEFIKKIEKLL